MRKNPELLPLPPPEQIAAEMLVDKAAARDIAFLLGTYPDVVRTALRTHEPSGWSRLRSGWRMRSRARGRRWWSRARRTSSGRRRGRRCGSIWVSGMCSGLRCGVEHSSVGVHVRVEWILNLVSSPFGYWCTLRRGALMIQQDYMHISPE